MMHLENGGGMINHSYLYLSRRGEFCDLAGLVLHVAGVFISNFHNGRWDPLVRADTDRSLFETNSLSYRYF